MSGERWALTFVWLPGTERVDLISDDDWQRVERELIANPQAGTVIRGLGGARKLRVRVGTRGKSAGARTIYVYFVRAERIYFLLTYGKNEVVDLTNEQRQIVRTTVVQLQREEG